MYIKVLIISIILIAIIIMALGIKLFFNKSADNLAHACALEDGKFADDGSCAVCELKDLADCPEKQ